MVTMIMGKKHTAYILILPIKIYITHIICTSHELTITITLNLRNGVDNYIYKLLRAWNRLGYNLSTGETTLKKDYVADWFKVVIANRAGDIFKEVIYKDVMLIEGLSGFDELDYTSNDHVDLEFKLKSDWADDTDA